MKQKKKSSEKIRKQLAVNSKHFFRIYLQV